MKAIQHSDPAALGGDPDDRKMYFGYTPLLMVRTSSERPENAFILKKDGIAQHVMALHRKSPQRFMTMPYPVFAFRVSNEYAAEEFAGLATSSELLCHFREVELMRGNEDYMCRPRSAEYRDRMPCCEESKEDQTLANEDRIPVVHLPNVDGDEFRPNWQQLIGNLL